MTTFQTPVSEFLYQLEPDAECGTVEGMGWHGLYLGDLGVENPEFKNLTYEDQEQLVNNEAAILFEASGQVEMALFDSVEEAEDLWEDILTDSEEESKRKEGAYAPDDPYQVNPYEDIEKPAKYQHMPWDTRGREEKKEEEESSAEADF